MEMFEEIVQMLKPFESITKFISETKNNIMYITNNTKYKK